MSLEQISIAQNGVTYIHLEEHSTSTRKQIVKPNYTEIKFMNTVILFHYTFWVNIYNTVL